ncbi:uncharacterized protein LOC141987327 isoform X2 [Natator depressus]|uniref:uncharacterized protein LOC141987327 isoform X2 n=1 Tax=Natator depressus TaxID=27790 RepID=UPI003EBC58A0
MSPGSFESTKANCKTGNLSGKLLGSTKNIQIDCENSVQDEDLNVLIRWKRCLVQLLFSSCLLIKHYMEPEVIPNQLFSPIPLDLQEDLAEKSHQFKQQLEIFLFVVGLQETPKVKLIFPCVRPLSFAGICCFGKGVSRRLGTDDRQICDCTI